MIGSEARGGKQLEWVEMRMEGGRKGHSMIYQMVVPGSVLDLGQVEEIVFQPGDKPAMKMTGPMMKMIRGQLEKQSLYGEMCKGVSPVGQERVTVPAGGFEALHFRNTEYAADSWVSPPVPFSLVKSAGKDYQVELEAQGGGAQSSIQGRGPVLDPGETAGNAGNGRAIALAALGPRSRH